MATQSSMEFKGRAFTVTDLELIREVVADCSGLSRQELANTVCELLGWRRPNGGLKTWECKELLSRLESSGRVELPSLRTTKPVGTRTSVPRTALGDPGEPITGRLGDVGPVTLRRLVTGEERRWWRELVGRYHYLGFKVAFGAQMRYFIEVACPAGRVVGCLQLSSPAWRMAVRDEWIGWSDGRRRRHLQRVVQNSRFLLLPWVEVRHLASHVLARMVREVPEDWERSYGVRPLLMETLVEEGRHAGTCYRAANWMDLGETRGRGRMDRHHRREGECPKRVLVYPLARGARERLRGKGSG